MFWKVLGITCGVGLAIGIGIGCAVAFKDHKQEVVAVIDEKKPKVVDRVKPTKKAPKAA